MEKVTLTLPAPKTLDKSVQLQNGVVSSGDLEVVFESSDGDTLTVIIKSSVEGIIFPHPTIQFGACRTHAD